MKRPLLFDLMAGTILLVCCGGLCFAKQHAARMPSVDLVVTHYDLKFTVKPEQKQFDARAQTTLRNRGTSAISRVPLMLYRLLKVQTAADSFGRPLSFSQQVVGMADNETWQVNQVYLRLRQPLLPGKETTVTLHYRGTLAGYAEVMAYVQDRVDEQYTLFRAETMPYPVPGIASYDAWARLYSFRFTYDVRVVVPKDYVVACGATQAQQKPAGEDLEFACSASAPQSQLNVAIARFKVLEDSANHLQVYALPDDAERGATVLDEMKRALDFYTFYFGPYQGATGLTVTELPEGWGSYTGEGFIYQTAAAFKDPRHVVELYHEVAHRWNAMPKPEIQRTRWFDEAFASYFAALALRKLSGEQAFVEDLERARNSFVRAAKTDAQVATVPIAEYGRKEMGRYSYTKGAWSLYVLHQVIGEEAFRRSVSQFLKEYQATPADFSDFKRVVEQVSGRNLQLYFDDWIFGAESSRLLIAGEPVTMIAKRYTG